HDSTIFHDTPHLSFLPSGRCYDRPCYGLKFYERLESLNNGLFQTTLPHTLAALSGIMTLCKHKVPEVSVMHGWIREVVAANVSWRTFLSQHRLAPIDGRVAQADFSE